MIVGQTGFNWVWTPIGRIGWHGQVNRSVLEKWRAPEGRRALLDAGFMDGSVELFEKALTCLTKLMSRMSSLWR